MCIAANTANEKRRYMQRRYHDIVNPAPKANENDDKKAQTIINRIKNKLGGG